MGLHLHRAERTDLVADGLGALLANPLPDPFAEELVLVPARGVERWLSQRLSHVLGPLAAVNAERTEVERAISRPFRDRQPPPALVRCSALWLPQ
jgi:exonuclease V gamma subunit